MAPQNLTILQVEKPTEAMVDEAVKIFCNLMMDGLSSPDSPDIIVNQQCHSTDPLCIALSGGDRELIPESPRAMMNSLAFIAGEMYTATDENGVMVGFTFWTKPGKCMFATEDQLALGYLQLLQKLSPECAAYHAQQIAKDQPAFVDECIGMPHVCVLPRGFFFSLIHGATLSQAEMATYWCNFAFVRKDYQGKGIATALIDLVYQKAKKTGEVMALATTNERNVRIYENLGFSVKGHQVVPSPWANWPIWIFTKPTNAA
ncbi:hypothetical protein BKA93DRAFT_153734 [Sparassis latifolia]